MVAKIAIRREDKNKWERRVPITPKHVKELLANEGIEVVVQPSEIRAFSDQEFEKAGAIIQEDISQCPVTFAVKEIPEQHFQAKNSYVFFSHVIKGQPYNMGMLKKMMALGCNLFDYEKIENSAGQRLVFFGRYAGLAGMIDTLWSLGEKLQSQQIDSPFNGIKKTVEYTNLQEAEQHLKGIGQLIREQGVPASLAPLVVGFAGYGNVSKGAQEIIDLLPVTEIAPGDLAELSENYSRHTLYKVVFKESDMVEPIDQEKSFSLKEYYSSPENYQSCFYQYLPQLSILVNCIFWNDSYPRLITKAQMKVAYTDQTKLMVIGDISVDINGAIEFTEKSTSPDNPSFVYDPAANKLYDDLDHEGVVVMAVDNLPCELPLESSLEFGDTLLPFVAEIAKADFSLDFEQLQLSPESKGALILHGGDLTPNFRYIEKYL